MATEAIEKKPVGQRASFSLSDPVNLLGLAAIILLALGITGFIQRLASGHTLVNYGSYVPWGLWVGVYVFLVWLEVGSLLVYSSLVYIFGWKDQLKPIRGVVYVAALGALTAALLLIGLDIGHPLRFWKAIFNPSPTSMMAWMVWLHMIYMALLVAEIILVVRKKKSQVARANDERTLQVLALIGLPVGLALVTVVGSLFGVISARPLWQGTVLPLYSLISALVTGGGLVTLLYLTFGLARKRQTFTETVEKMRKLLSGLLLFGLFAAALSGFVALYQGAPAQSDAARLALFGPYWWSFWVIHIGLGVLLPLVLLLTGKNAPRRVAVAAFLVMITFIAVPINFIIPALVTPELEGLTEAFTGPGLQLSYFPSLVEWSLTLFAMGVGLALFVAAYKLLPIAVKDEVAK